MSKSLNNLRIELSSINADIFELLNSRQKIIEQISKFKSENNLASWDPKQEMNLFKEYVSHYDERYDFLFSSLIEVQAYKCNDYPRWSLGSHLEQVNGNITDFINPILLLARNESEYRNLKLKKNIKLQIEGLI